MTKLKFILNENNKFILDERFILTEAEILTEASITDLAKNWTNEFKATLENSSATLDKFLEFAAVSDKKATSKATMDKLLTGVKSAGEELENSLEMPLKSILADLSAIKSEVSNYVKALNDALSSLDDDTQKLLPRRLGTLEALTEGELVWGPNDQKTVQEVITWVNDHVIPQLDLVDITAEEKNVKRFKDICTECKELIRDLTKHLPATFDTVKADDLKDYITLLKRHIDSKAVVLPAPTTINKGIVRANLVKIYLPKVEELKDAYYLIKNSPVLVGVEKSSQKADWETLYTKCKTTQDFKNFWDGDAAATDPVLKAGYWKGEWGTKFDFISTIKNPLSQEIKAFGWNSIDNPFIKYLKNDRVMGLTKNTYNAIHNAFIAKIIDKEDLMSGGKLGKLNLLFNPNFQKIGETAEEYLDSQNWIVENATTKWGGKLQTVFKNIMAARGNLENLLDEKTAEDIAQGFMLRPISEVKAVLKSAGKTTTKINSGESAAIPATEEEVAALIKKFADPAAAKKVLAYLATTHRKTLDKLGLTPTLLTKLKTNKGTTITTYQEDEAYDREFKNKLSSKQLINLLTTLAKQAKL